MATAIISIICIAMIILGGMTLSQGILTSADVAALSVNDISVREGEIARTELNMLRAAYVSWADLLRITVDNAGQTKLANFEKWDLIVNYYDDGGSQHNEWLPYTTEAPGDNEWQKGAIGLNGPVEFFEPDILNPEEELVMQARISPDPGDDTTGDITIATPNGIYESISFWYPGYTLLNPHSENTTIAGTEYYQLEEALPADGPAISHMVFVPRRTAGRWLLYNQDDVSRYARHVFPLTGISQIPATTWTAYYRCLALGLTNIQNHEVNFNIDIIIRQADGTVRTTLASIVANASLLRTEIDQWITKSGTYDFPGYTVVDDSDSLEILFYGEIIGNGSNDDGALYVQIDDNTLPLYDQTRITA